LLLNKFFYFFFMVWGKLFFLVFGLVGGGLIGVTGVNGGLWGLGGGGADWREAKGVRHNRDETARFLGQERIRT